MRRRQTPPAPARWGAPLLALAAALAMIAGGPAPAARGQERVAVPYALPTPGPCLERDKDGAPILPDRYWYCTTPLSTNAITVVSWHFCNSSSLPMRINPKSFSQPSVDDLSIDLPPPPWEMRDTDTPQDCLSQFPWARLAIGGEDSDGFYPDIDRVVWSHFIPESVPPYTFFGHHRAYITCSFSYRFCWRKRAGIELLPGEGYMRRVTFFPGWELNPRRPTFPFHWNPGRQPLIRHPDWDETFDDGWHNPADVVVPGVSALEIYDRRIFHDTFHAVLPFRYRVDVATAEAAAQAHAAAQKAAKEAPGLFAELEMAPVAAIGEGLAITYVIGVRGREPPRPARRFMMQGRRMWIEDDPDRMESAGYCVNMWLEQKSVVPANAVLTLKEGAGGAGREIARFDGKGLRAQLAAMPSRAPAMLHTGEFLAYHRFLPAAALPKLRKGAAYTLELALTANCAQYVPPDRAPYDFDRLSSPVAPPPLDQLSPKPLRAAFTFRVE